MTPSELGPVSATLEADLRTWVRRHGIVLWLDLDNHYSSFVDRLIRMKDEGAIPYEIRAFRGSHLELLLDMESLESGVEKTPLLIHLPGFNEDSIRETPLLEFYFAGARYRQALDTLLNDAAGANVRPEQIKAFRERGAFTLEEADAWLTDLLAEREGGLGSHLRALSLPAVIDELLGGGFVASRVGLVEDLTLLWERLTAWTGLPESWRGDVLPPGVPRAEEVAFAAASWALAVEYVEDLKRPPVAARLQAARTCPARSSRRAALSRPTCANGIGGSIAEQPTRRRRSSPTRSRWQRPKTLGRSTRFTLRRTRLFWEPWRLWVAATGSPPRPGHPHAMPESPSGSATIRRVDLPGFLSPTRPDSD